MIDYVISTDLKPHRFVTKTGSGQAVEEGYQTNVAGMSVYREKLFHYCPITVAGLTATLFGPSVQMS